MRVAKERRRQRGITLVELLVVIVISSIVGTMLIMSWFSLNDAYSYTVFSSQTRDSARQAIARMTREIRDAEAPANTGVAVVRARTWWILLYTTFNDSGNTSYGSAPRLVAYRLYKNPSSGRYEIWRFSDQGGSAGISNFSTPVQGSPADSPSGFDYNETQTGEGAMLMVGNVVNFGSSPVPQTSLFRYSKIEADGSLTTPDYVLGDADRQNILAVRIRLLSDMNPERAPVYVDLQASAQLRNQRQF